MIAISIGYISDVAITPKMMMKPKICLKIIFLDLYMKLNTFKGHSKFTSWLYAFTKNRCINYLNRTNFKKIDQRKDMNIDVSDLTLPFEDDNSKQEIGRAHV